MDGCIPMEALGTLDALGPEDATRRHAETCARCSAMWVAYREFLRADTPRNARGDDADTRLAAFIKQRVEGVEIAGGPRRARGRWFEIPMMRFAAAAAVLLVAAVAVTQWLPGSSDSEETALRGDPRIVVTLETPRALADGTVELKWTSVPDADAYQVVLLREDLTEIVRMPATGEHVITLDPSGIPADATRWQVTALREGAVAAESTPARLSE
jgi:hypothetical protein